MENGGHTSEELLEFSFRRVFDNMSETERKVMQVLAIVSDLPIEALNYTASCLSFLKTGVTFSFHHFLMCGAAL